MALPVPKAQLALKASKVRLAPQVLLVRTALLVLRVPKVPKVPKV
jgi:hypothetical protein